MSTSENKLQAIRLRSDFYRQWFRRIIWVLLVSFVLSIGLVGYLFFLHMHGKSPLVINAVTDDGQMIPLHPTTLS